MAYVAKRNPDRGRHGAQGVPAARHGGQRTGGCWPVKRALAEVARPEGFEPPTPRFVVWCSIQLSYGRGLEAG